MRALFAKSGFILSCSELRQYGQFFCREMAIFQHANGVINLRRFTGPISTDVTASWRNTQASAICDSFWPRLSASVFSFEPFPASLR
jgi:propanediol utilization protein